MSNIDVPTLTLFLRDACSLPLLQVMCFVCVCVLSQMESVLFYFLCAGCFDHENLLILCNPLYLLRQFCSIFSLLKHNIKLIVIIIGRNNIVFLR